MTRKKLAWLAPAGLLIGLAVVVYHALLFRPGEISYGASSDLELFFLPRMLWAADFAKTFLRVPRWDPFSYSGMPFIGNMQSPGYYPFNWLVLALPAWRFFSLYLVAHALAGGGFTYVLGRRLGFGRAAASLAAIVYQTSGFYVAHLYAGHIAHMGNTPWLPLEVLAALEIVRRRQLIWVAVLALAGALQFLSGHPQFFVYSLTFAFAFALVDWLARPDKAPKRTVPLAALALALLLGLSAVELLPGLEFAGTMEGARQAPLGYSGSFSLSGPDVARLLFGRRIGFDMASLPTYWETCGFVGMLTIALAAAGAWFGRKRHAETFLAVSAVVSVLFAMGPSGGVYYFFYYVIPGYATFRAPARMLLVFTLAAALLAAYGLEGFARLRAPRLKCAGLFVGFALAATALVVAALRTVGWVSGAWGDAAWAFRQPWTIAAAVVSVAAAGAVAARLRGAAWLAVGAVALDLAAFAWPLVQTVPQDELLWPSKIIQHVAADERPFRIIHSTDSLMVAHLTRAGIESVQCSHDASMFGHFERLMRGRKKDLDRYLDYCRLMNVRYLITRGRKDAPGFEQVMEESPPDGNMPNVLYRFKDHRGRAFVVGRTRRLPEGKPLVTAMNDLEAAREAYVEDDAAVMGGEPSDTPARVTAYTVDEMTVEVTLDRPGYLVVSQIWHPGWKILSERGALRVYRTDGALLGTPLEAGRHTLRIVYDPASIRIGRVVTLVALALTIITLVAGAVTLRRGVEPQGEEPRDENESREIL